LIPPNCSPAAFTFFVIDLVPASNWTTPSPSSMK
jgi:hypothetical protein